MKLIRWENRHAGETAKNDPPHGFRTLSAVLGAKCGAACTVWETLSAEAMDFLTFGTGGTKLIQVPPDEVRRVFRDQAANTVVLWLMDPDDHERFRAAGGCDCEMEEYLSRLSAAVESIGSRYCWLLYCRPEDIARAKQQHSVGSTAAAVYFLTFELVYRRHET